MTCIRLLSSEKSPSKLHYKKDKYWHLGFLLSTAIINCMMLDATIFAYHSINILKFNRHTWYISHENMKNFLLYFWWYFCLTFLFLNNSNSGRFQNYYVHFWRGKNQVVNVKRTAGLTATLLLLLRFYKRWFSWYTCMSFHVA